MRLSLPVLVATLAPTGLASVEFEERAQKPALTATAASTLLTTENCATSYKSSSKNGAVPTSTITSSVRIPKIVFHYKTSTPIATVTPKTTTNTLTAVVTSTTTTTLATVTDVFSTTSTILSTITESTTTTFTSTELDSTTTTSTSTTTYSPSAYTPIQSSSGDQNYGTPQKKRQVNHPHAEPLARRASKQSSQDATQLCPSRKYPWSVTCTNFVQVEYIVEIINVAPTSTTTLPAPQATVTSTSTYVSTSTDVPHASSTTTLSTTLVATTTTTFSVTTTSTTTTTIVAQPTATIYAPCVDGLLGPRISNGDYLYQYDPTAASTITDSTADSAYDCCVQCFTNPNCLFGVYTTGSDSGICEINYGDTCAGQPASGYFTETTSSNIFDSIYYNGPCGSLTAQGAAVF